MFLDFYNLKKSEASTQDWCKFLQEKITITQFPNMSQFSATDSYCGIIDPVNVFFNLH